MPQPDEQEVLYAIGDEITAALVDARTGHDAPNVLYLARSTCGGVRELVFRVHDAEIANRVLRDRIKSRTWERAWEFRMEADREWEQAAPFFAIYPSH